MPDLTHRYTGPIIDAHHHLWALGSGRYPWLSGPDGQIPLGDLTYLRRDYLPADFLADTAGLGISASIHIEALWDRGRSPVEETEWLDSLDRPPGVAARYVAAAPLEAHDVEAVLDAQARHPRVVGIRETIRWHPDPAKRWTRQGIVDEPGWRRGLAALRRHGFLLELLMNPHQALEVAALAAATPDQIFVVNHCGTPNDRDAEGLARWRHGLVAMAGQPNIAIKLSHFPAYNADGSQAGDRGTIMTIIDAFGPGRCLFGSDYPVARRTASYPAMLARFRAVVAELSAGEQSAILHDNAVRLYRVGETTA